MINIEVENLGISAIPPPPLLLIALPLDFANQTQQLALIKSIMIRTRMTFVIIIMPMIKMMTFSRRLMIRIRFMLKNVPWSRVRCCNMCFVKRNHKKTETWKYLLLSLFAKEITHLQRRHGRLPWKLLLNHKFMNFSNYLKQLLLVGANSNLDPSGAQCR